MIACLSVQAAPNESEPFLDMHDDPEFKEDREAMVHDQMGDEGRFARDPVTDEKVLAAMRRVPRHAFVPERRRRLAYEDRPLAIGYGQTISQPYMVAYMTALLELKPDDKVLEIGTGSGYQAAILAELVKQVYTIEIVPELHLRTNDLFETLEYTNVETRLGDGYHGWREHGPYDAIIVTAAASHIPPPLVEQLKPGGKMAIPVGAPFSPQTLMLLTKNKEGRVKKQLVMGVRFVPLTRSKDAAE
jgi:protein-L-isoaspartate(D-aspartate) O-methyltransferase